MPVKNGVRTIANKKVSNTDASNDMIFQKVKPTSQKCAISPGLFAFCTPVTALHSNCDLYHTGNRL